MKLAGSDIIVKILETNDTRYVFGVPGGHLCKFYDSIYYSDEITPILTKHESGASFMATGYAQVSHKLGVCTGTVGPGATNLVTGIASAYMDSIPVLVITAQVGSSAIGKGGLQESTGVGRTVDHVELFDGMTKYSERITSIDKVRENIQNAYRLAINGRSGPVHLDVMANVFAGEIDITQDELNRKIKRVPTAAIFEDVNKVSDLILSAKKPAILAGAGALNACTEILSLAEMLGIPVATTLRAKGIIPEDHELSLGCVGLYGTNIANKYLRDGIDVLIAVGTSFSEFTSHAWDSRFQPSEALIQIDIDAWELGKNYPATVGLMGDADIILHQILEAVKRKNPSTRLTDTSNLKKMKEQREYFADPKMLSDAVPLKPQRFMKLLRDSLADDTIVFGDIGNTLPWLENFFLSKMSNTFFICSSLASMGYGVSASIGGQIAATDRRVICVCGDGDFQMQGMEVATAVNYNIPVIWFVLNNQSLAMISDLQNLMFGGRRVSSEFINPDFVKFAEAMGAVGLRITRPDEVETVVKEALEKKRPTVVDVLIDADEAPSFDARAEAMTRAWGTSAPILKKLKLVPQLIKRM
ncbi:MAG: thiamine pyrophosphate-binding protein [Dehalococcoidales bacterium]|nr:thiamine pyrophosphate-binding protein [Dehalococcoidales bacterium]